MKYYISARFAGQKAGFWAVSPYYSYIFAKIYRKCISNTSTCDMVQHILRFITFYSHCSCTVKIAHFRVYLGIVNFTPKKSKVKKKILYSNLQLIGLSFTKNRIQKYVNAQKILKIQNRPYNFFTVK